MTYTVRPDFFVHAPRPEQVTQAQAVGAAGTVALSLLFGGVVVTATPANSKEAKLVAQNDVYQTLRDRLLQKISTAYNLSIKEPSVTSPPNYFPNSDENQTLQSTIASIHKKDADLVLDVGSSLYGGHSAGLYPMKRGFLEGKRGHSAFYLVVDFRLIDTKTADVLSQSTCRFDTGERNPDWDNEQFPATEQYFVDDGAMMAALLQEAETFCANELDKIIQL